MSPDKVIVIAGGLIGIIFTYWFFLRKGGEAVVAEDEIDIEVAGGYQPDTIKIPVNKKMKLNVLRKDPSSCLEEIVIEDFKVKKYLPLNEKVTIEVTPVKKGIFPFHCGMNMFHGKIIVD